MMNKAELEYEVVGVVDFRSWGLLDTSAIGHPVTALALAYDGTLSVTGNTTGQIQLWDTDTIEVPSKWMEAIPRSKAFSSSPIRSVDISRAKQFIAVCD